MNLKESFIAVFDLFRIVFAFLVVSLLFGAILTALIPPIWWMLRFWFNLWGQQ